MTRERRAFWLGYRAGLRKAETKMRCKVDQWEDEICELQDTYQALIDDVRAAKDERAVKEATTERAMYPDGWLN